MNKSPCGLADPMGRDAQTHSALGNGTSDILRLLSAVGAYEYAGGGAKFCAENFVRQKVSGELHLSL